MPRWVLEQHRAVHALDASDKFVEISEMLALHDAEEYTNGSKSETRHHPPDRAGFYCRVLARAASHCRWVELD
jgi:hypothetical protein